MHLSKYSTQPNQHMAVKYIFFLIRLFLNTFAVAGGPKIGNNLDIKSGAKISK